MPGEGHGEGKGKMSVRMSVRVSTRSRGISWYLVVSRTIPHYLALRLHGEVGRVDVREALQVEAAVPVAEGVLQPRDVRVREDDVEAEPQQRAHVEPLGGLVTVRRPGALGSCPRLGLGFALGVGLGLGLGLGLVLGLGLGSGSGLGLGLGLGLGSGLGYPSWSCASLLPLCCSGTKVSQGP